MYHSRHLKFCFAEENVAIYGKATQSSLYDTGIAYNAIDGNRVGHSNRVSCSHTAGEFNPWWRLDLGKTHKVFSINISNRVEYHNRINGAEIRVGDLLDNNGNNNPRYCKVFLKRAREDKFICAKLKCSLNQKYFVFLTGAL